MNSYGLDSLSYRLVLQDELGSTNSELVFGIHKDATDTIDFSLGEVDAPQFPPPNSLYAVFLVTDSVDMEVFHTYFDFRPIPKVQYFYKNYRFKIFNLGTPYTISWPELGANIDSAFIRDIFTGKLVNVDMKAKQTHRVENFSQNQFNIVVYYNQGTIGVENDVISLNHEYIFPNPVTSTLYLNIDNIQYLNYKIVNELGSEVQSGNLGKERNIILNSLSDGMYFLILNDEVGNIKSYHFIKI